jgi:hypothetical protein
MLQGKHNRGQGRRRIRTHSILTALQPNSLLRTPLLRLPALAANEIDKLQRAESRLFHAQESEGGRRMNRDPFTVAPNMSHQFDRIKADNTN